MNNDKYIITYITDLKQVALSRIGWTLFWRDFMAKEVDKFWADDRKLCIRIAGNTRPRSLTLKSLFILPL